MKFPELYLNHPMVGCLVDLSARMILELVVQTSPLGLRNHCEHTENVQDIFYISKL